MLKKWEAGDPATTRPLEADEPVGLRRVCRDLPAFRDGLRRLLLRVGHLQARQGRHRRGAPEKRLRHGRARQHGLPSAGGPVRAGKKRGAQEGHGAAARRHEPLHQPGHRDRHPQGHPARPRLVGVRGRKRAGAPLQVPLLDAGRTRVRVGVELLPPVLRHGLPARGKNEVARGQGGGRRRPHRRRWWSWPRRRSASATRSARLSEEEIKRRAAVIGTGAIKYYLLRVRPHPEHQLRPGRVHLLRRVHRPLLPVRLRADLRHPGEGRPSGGSPTPMRTSPGWAIWKSCCCSRC